MDSVTGSRPNDFLSLPLSDPGVEGLIRWLVESPDRSHPRTAAYLNAHTVNLALRDASRMAPLWRNMDLLYPDGMSVVRAAGRMGLPVRHRVSAAGFFRRFCWAAAARGRSIALVGGTEAVVDGCATHLLAEVPGLQIAFSHHGFFKPGKEEDAVRRGLRAAAPDITLLGMGSPRQEALALRLRDEDSIPTVWCVGALFEYHSPGKRRLAPVWMRESGLEWAFRLAQEPRRLARRYLMGNAEFLLRCRGWI